MGETYYFTTIGRGVDKEEWRSNPIFIDEWQDVVDGDPTLAYLETLPAGPNPLTGQWMRRPSRWSARWSAHPQQVPLVFEWKADHLALTVDDEDVELGAPDAETRAKAEAIAAVLRAVVHVKRVDFPDIDDGEDEEEEEDR